MNNTEIVANEITPELLTAFEHYLHILERAESTVDKYLHYVREFAAFLDGSPVTKSAAVDWKMSLQADGSLKTSTVNLKIAAVNALFVSLGRPDCKVKLLRVQRRLFRDTKRDLSREEYRRLINVALKLGKEMLSLLIETLGSTGIRVSELQYITVEAAQEGWVEISLKGKIRTILLPGKLARKLLKYAKKQKITAGQIFLDSHGEPMSRHQIWVAMKSLCKEAKVEPTKVFPHNLRHMFAREYYRVHHDVIKLADLLGHSSISTTRIYLVDTGKEHVRQLDQLGLVS